MNILYTIDEKIIDILKEALFSLKYYNKEVNFNIYIMYEDISNDKIEDLEKYIKDNIGNIKFIKFDSKNISFPIVIDHTTKTTYFRLFAPYILDDNIDRILYLDYDVFCNGSIEELYNSDFEGKTIIGVLDHYLSEFYEYYINAGVCLINLKQYRKKISSDDIVKYIFDNFDDLDYQDQTVLNDIFKNDKKYVDEIYNYQINTIEEEYDYPVLIHYVTHYKPWKDDFYSPQRALIYYKNLYLMGNEKKALKLSKKHFKNQFYLNFNPNNYDEDTIDIIMPSYNATKTICKTLDSIIKQKLGKLEVIVYLIDDCSDEDYSPILKKYKDKLNIKYFRLEKNSGVALARQKGIDEGKSKYFTIIDSDDQFISPYAIASMYCCMKDNDVDVVRSIFFEEKNYNYQTYKLYRGDNIACHGKLYNRDFIKNNKITYLDLRGNEDTAYNALLKACNAKYYDLDIMTYRWCDNQNSFTRSDYLYHETDLMTFARGFVWTTQEIIKRKDYITDFSYEIAYLMYWIYLRINDCWYDETKDDMYNSTAKIYFLYRKNTNYPLGKMITDNFEIDDINDLYYDFFYKINDYMLKLPEYKKMSRQEKINFGELCLDSYDYNDSKLEYDENIVIGNNSLISGKINLDNFRGKIYIGNDVKIKSNLIVRGDSDIYIDNNSVIDENVTILTNKNIINSKYRNYIYTSDVHIKENVYIGNGVIINCGVTIGKNSYIENGSVVFDNVDDNSINSGNPCTKIDNIGEYDDIFYNYDKKIRFVDTN